MIRRLLRALVGRPGERRDPVPALGTPRHLYEPCFSPWLDAEGFGKEYEWIRPYTLVDPARCWVLHSLARQARHLEGEFWECGVYRGGTARLLAMVADTAQRTVRLFDTFEGMPKSDPEMDWHVAGDFADTSEEFVRSLVNYSQAVLHKGIIPATFRGLESRVITLAHVDVDLYRSVLDCCAFIYPRLVRGGVMVFDDYGWPTCVGARIAVDEFFTDKPEVPLVLPTGQAVVTRLPGQEL